MIATILATSGNNYEYLKDKYGFVLNSYNLAKNENKTSAYNAEITIDNLTDLIELSEKLGQELIIVSTRKKQPYFICPDYIELVIEIYDYWRE